MPRSRRQDSDPVLEVSAVGTANSEGEYVQHEAVAPQKAHATLIDPLTVVVRDGQATADDTTRGVAPGRAGDSNTTDATGPLQEETTAVTKSRQRSAAMNWYRLLAFVEHHRVATLTLLVGTLFIVFAALLATR